MYFLQRSPTYNRSSHPRWAALLAGVLVLAHPKVHSDTDPLLQLRWLQGQWSGQGTGPTGPSAGQRDIVCALECRYLNVEASHRELGNNSEAGHYSALAMWTWHPGRARLLLHTFSDMAAVTTYEQDLAGSGPNQLVMLHRNPRDGSRARLIYRFEPPDAFVERYEQAPPEQGWTLQREYRFIRVRSRAPVTVWPQALL
jgi:hypothetical protein